MRKLINRIIVLLLVLTVPLMAMAERPNFDEKKSKKETSEKTSENPVKDLVQPVETEAVLTQPESVSGQETAELKKMELTEDMIDIMEKYEKYLKQKQFNKAREYLIQLPENSLNDAQKKQKRTLNIFYKIDEDNKENERQFGKDESLDEDAQRTVKRLQRSGKHNILIHRNSLAKDILIQSLYLDRKNYVSKQLLDRNLSLPLGSYKVENIEAKYWKESLIFLRSGYPQKSVDALDVLANFDPKNPAIFERMGSSFYMSGEVKKAIEAWKRALYLDPKNKSLKTFIKNAEVELKRQDSLTKQFLAQKKEKKKAKTETVDMQVLRVVADSNTAYSYAQEVRQQMKGMNVVVHERDDGKWEVKIPKKKSKKTSEKEKK